jgi:hypothetical protein
MRSFRFAVASAIGALLASALPTRAQNFATFRPGAPGIYFADGDCSDPALPCTLNGAVQDATDGGLSGNRVHMELPHVGGTASQRSLGIRAGGNLVLDTYLDDGIPTTGVSGVVELDELALAPGVTVELPANLALHLRGRESPLALGNGSSVLGDGLVSLLSPGLVRIEDPAAPFPGFHVAHVENLRMEVPEGTVAVRDEDELDGRASTLQVEALTLVAGTLDMGDNELEVVGMPAEWRIDGTVRGRNRLTFNQLDADLGGFPNDRAGALPVRGDGRLLIDLETFSDSGVLLELSEFGGGGITNHFLGTLFVTRATKVHGSFRVEPEEAFEGARAEFDAPLVVTGSLEVHGPGEEVFPGDGLCDTGDESGAFFHAPVEVLGDLLLVDSDVTTTPACVEGITFAADALPGSGQVRSRVRGSFSAAGTSRLALDSAAGGAAHNLVVEGDLAFDEPPLFEFASPAAGGPFCTGNELVLGGARDPQTLRFQLPAAIPSLRVEKDAAGQIAALDPASASLLVSQGLTVARGQLVDSGLLDPGGAPQGSGPVCADCPPLPRSGCRQATPGASSLVLKEANGKLRYEWARGEATELAALGDPTAETDYSVCLYDEHEGVPYLALAASAPAGADWSSKPTGFRYARNDGAPDGLRRLKLRTGGDGEARVLVMGSQVGLPTLPLAQDPKLVVQVASEVGCFESVFFNTAKRNDARKFRDRE